MAQQIYISYASEDRNRARSLYHQLAKDGFDPWLDDYSLKAGDWEIQIEPAIRSSAVFVFLISTASTSRKGGYSDEIKIALRLNRENSATAPRFVPLRLDPSSRPFELDRFQSFDLFEPDGYERFKHAVPPPVPGTSRLVLSLHGIKTRGVWQKHLTPLLAEEGFIPAPGDFGYFRAIQLLYPPSRGKQVDLFMQSYVEACRLVPGEPPSVVCHSYGTYIVGFAMLKNSQIRFDRIILCGSILPEDFPWGRLAENKQVHSVLNQFGGRDFWARIVAWVVADAGQSGLRGFSAVIPCLTQQCHPLFRHSDYFNQLNYASNWLPFLKAQPLAPEPVPEQPRRNWRFRLTMAIVTMLLLAYGIYNGSLTRMASYFYPAPRAYEGEWVSAGTPHLMKITSRSPPESIRGTTATVQEGEVLEPAIPSGESLYAFSTEFRFQYDSGTSTPCWRFGENEGPHYRFCYFQPSQVQARQGSAEGCYFSGPTEEKCSPLAATDVTNNLFQEFKAKDRLHVRAEIAPPAFEFTVTQDSLPDGLRPDVVAELGVTGGGAKVGEQHLAHTLRWTDPLRRVLFGNVSFTVLTGAPVEVTVNTLTGLVTSSATKKSGANE